LKGERESVLFLIVVVYVFGLINKTHEKKREEIVILLLFLNGIQNRGKAAVKTIIWAFVVYRLND
jgi:hypothetical protein